MVTKLHVGNIAYTTTSDKLLAAFSEGGRKVQTVSIATSKRNGDPRGFAFVQMETEADAQAAIASLNEREIDGRAITVAEARGRFRPGR